MEAGRPRERWWRAAVVVVLLVAGWRGALRLAPRDGGDVLDAPARARLLEHVRRLAAAPRPLGTAAHDRARDYLLAQLRALGLQPEVQRATAVLDRAPLVYVAEVENVVARIEGATPDAPAVLVASHYDSALTSPGAADDAAGVASMLELARVLRERRRPGNAVILLFSDGEERGLLGARSFARAHPWARQVAAAINLEARGSGGRPVLIELGGAASKLLGLLDDSGASVMLGSYVTEGYRRSGNDTDFTVFRQAGWPGYNLAFFGDPASYHTARDTAARLDPETLVAHAHAATQLTLALIETPLAPLAAAQDVVYAAGPAGHAIAVPRPWALLLALLALVSSVALAASVRRRSRPRGVAVAAATLLASVVAAVVAVALNGGLLGWLAGAARVRWEEGDGFLLSSLLLAAAVAVAGVVVASRWCQRHELALGLAVLLGALAVAVSVGVPSASLLAVVPALAVPAALAVDLWRRRDGSVLYAILFSPVAILWGEAGALLAIGLGQRAQAVVAALAALAALLLAMVVPGALAALRWRASAALLAASVAAATLGWVRSRSAEDFPVANHLVLAVDQDEHTARWATFDAAADAWTRQLIARPEPADLRSFFGGRAAPALTTAAAYSSWEASRVVRAEVGDATSGPSLQLLPAPGVTTVRLDIYCAAEVRAASVAGQAVPVPAPGDPALPRLSLLYLHPPTAGATISLALSAPAEVHVVVVDIRQGALTGLVPPRPAGLVPGARWPTDAALIRSSARFAVAGEAGPS